MKQILFIHSAEKQGANRGSRHIVSYLTESLTADYQIFCPLMPCPERPNYQLWKDRIEDEMKNLGDDIILIGHSLGGSVILKFLSEQPVQKSIAGLFLIAPPFWGRDDDWQIDEYKLSENFADALPEIPLICIYHSRDDQWVPYSHLFDYAEALPKAILHKFGVRGHNFTNGIPELVDDITNLTIRSLQQ